MSRRPDPARLEEAANWYAARRRGVMSLEERRDCQAWLAHPNNAAALAEMERTWDWLGVAQGEFCGAPPQVLRRARARANRALVAAMCVVSLGIGILSYSGDNRFWTTLDWTDR